MQKKFFEILVLTALTVGLIWTILELTPKSALLFLTILYLEAKKSEFLVHLDRFSKCLKYLRNFEKQSK
jgi:hypothetical protein